MGEARRRFLLEQIGWVRPVSPKQIRIPGSLTEALLVESGKECEVCGTVILRNNKKQYTRFCSDSCRKSKKR